MPIPSSIYERFFDRYIFPIQDAIIQRLSLLFSKHRKHYIQRLLSQNRFFNIKGITVQSIFSLELQKVYIELDISSYQIFSKQSSDAYDIKRWTIWELLSSKEPAYPILSIIGKPGAGKTTLLQHITLSLASHKAPIKCNHFLPFQIALRKYVPEILESQNGQVKIAQLFASEFKNLKIPTEWFEKQLTKKGRHCIVLLDGLDEVADPKARIEVAQWVELQTRLHRDCHFILTSRPHGYHGINISDAVVLQIEDFSELQINDFVSKWYRATEVFAAGRQDRGILDTAEINAQDLLQRIYQSHVLSKLAVNPLLLTMITMVHRYVGKLPELRAALYEDICRVLLGRREPTIIKNIKLNVIQKRAILQSLAIELMKREKRELPITVVKQILTPSLELVGLRAEDVQEFIDKMMNESGLLIETTIDHIGFAHLTYQEYLTAVEIKNLQQEKLLQKKIGDSWWYETTLLYSALTDATRLIQFCLDVPRTLEKLKLAYELSQEAMQIAPEERARLEKELVLEAESDDQDRQQLASDLIFELRLKKMVRLSNEVEVDPFFISQVEYQSFINATQLRPDHWTGWYFMAGKGLTPTTGIRLSDAEKYAKWITERALILGHRNFYFRLPTSIEASTVRPSINIDDPNFQKLADLNVGTWCSNLMQVVFINENILDSQRQKLLSLGEEEIKRIPDYYHTIYYFLESLSKQLESLNRDITTSLKEINRTSFESISEKLPDRSDQFLNRIRIIQKDCQTLEARAQQRGFSVTLDRNNINRLDSSLIELNRLRSKRAGKEAYKDSDKNQIILLLTNTLQQLNNLIATLSEPLLRSQVYFKELFNRIEQNLREFPLNAIDLEQYLKFLEGIKDTPLTFEEIKLVQMRTITKSYERARVELLALAEYYFNINKYDFAKPILQAFWAIFLIEQRSKERDPFPAWEGIRLVKEIKTV